MKMKDYVGMKVRTLCDLRSGLQMIPKGMDLTVSGTWRGTFNLRGEPCSRCGVAIFIRQVPKRDVQLVIPVAP